uniref:Uncharacterized protein n=1 Tax=Tanacetum cinerariifolium TaxID=118510 RepID=A0A699HBP8_TANCI|nr:hypothetical protein [Tanacetum cinerariifolium]
MLHLEGKLFESLLCLVFVRRDCIGCSKFTIYQTWKGCSVWSSEYIVNTDDFMNLLLEGWSIRSIVWSIVLGEKGRGFFYNHQLVCKDPKINSRKYTIKNSFTLGSTEEADKVKILQSCNGLLLCTGSRRHDFDYVYNPSTNLLKILPEPGYANVDSNVFGCAGFRERKLEPFAMYDMRPKQVDHKIYEFIPSHASV